MSLSHRIASVISMPTATLELSSRAIAGLTSVGKSVGL